MHCVAHGKGNRIRLDRVAILIGNDTVDLTTSPLIVHLYSIGVPSEARSLSEHGGIRVLIVPGVGQTVTNSFQFDLVSCPPYHNDTFGLQDDFQLGGGTDQFYGVSSNGVTACIGDNAIDLPFCPLFVHHIVISVVLNRGFLPGLTTGIAEVPLVFQLLSLSLYTDTVALAQKGFAIDRLFDNNRAGLYNTAVDAHTVFVGVCTRRKYRQFAFYGIFPLQHIAVLNSSVIY